MVRDIKFRSYLTVTKLVDGKQTKTHIMTYDFVYHNIEPVNDLLNTTENLMQFIGIKDKHGKEIYEGDIVKTRLSRSFNQLETWIVEWHQPECMFRLKSIDFNNYTHWVVEYEKDVEVAGNIYENPELLTITERSEP